MEKREIIEKIREFISTAGGGKDKKTAQLMGALGRVTTENLMIGDPPSYFRARLECNSTGVGESSFGGTTTQRTVAMDYTTDELFFIDGDEATARKGLELFYLKRGQTLNYYRKNEAKKVATREGFLRHSRSFHDLNFHLTDHRLNRFSMQITQNPFSAPIRPISAVLSEKGDKIMIGYIYEADGVEHVLIEPQGITSAQEEGFRFKPWMLLFLFCPILIPVAILIPIVKGFKERMIG